MLSQANKETDFGTCNRSVTIFANQDFSVTLKVYTQYQYRTYLLNIWQLIVYLIVTIKTSSIHHFRQHFFHVYQVYLTKIVCLL
jgi:hypothetical protein